MDAFIGIDPGKSGAVALLTEGEAVAIDWPGDPGAAATLLAIWARRYDIRLAALERVSARPGQGVVSMFSFGQNYGAWMGILAAMRIPYILPTPKQWQAGVVDRKAGSDPKARSLAAARRLFPEADLSRKKDHGRADALLLAWYARREAGK